MPVWDNYIACQEFVKQLAEVQGRLDELFVRRIRMDEISHFHDSLGTPHVPEQ
jgi:hypothetical protein